MDRITRDQILLGTAAVEDYPVEALGGALVTLRPISGREWMNLTNKRLKSMEKGGAVQKNPRTGEVKFDLEAIQAQNFTIKCGVVSLAMLEPRLTPDDVGSLKLDVMEEIYLRIREISGLDPKAKEEVEKFRKQPGGAGTGEDSDEIPAGPVTP